MSKKAISCSAQKDRVKTGLSRGQGKQKLGLSRNQGKGQVGVEANGRRKD
jgi:hypothetical protein